MLFWGSVNRKWSFLKHARLSASEAQLPILLKFFPVSCCIFLSFVGYLLIPLILGNIKARTVLSVRANCCMRYIRMGHKYGMQFKIKQFTNLSTSTPCSKVPAIIEAQMILLISHEEIGSLHNPLCQERYIQLCLRNFIAWQRFTPQ